MNFLRYLGIVCRDAALETSDVLNFASGSSAEGWVLAKCKSNSKLNQFIVAVDGVVQAIGRAPTNITEYTDKATQKCINSTIHAFKV